MGRTRAPAVRFVVGAPEQLFGVDGLTCHADGSISGRMPTGPWLAGRQSTETATLGGLGVLADTVLGHANHVVVPPGREWSVTTELSLELVGEMPTDGEELVAVGHVVGADGSSALARGEIRAAGRTVAVGSERGRYVADGPPAEAFASGAVEHGVQLPERADVASLGELFGAAGPMTEQMSLTVSPRVTNPQGNLHGGISLALVDLVASAAVPGERVTTSIHMTYLRPLRGGAGAISLIAVPVHRGRSLALVDVQGRGEDGKLIFAGRVVRE